MAGSTVTAQWEAPVPGDAFCFEQQTPPEPPKQGLCIQQEFPANSIHVERGRERPKPPAVPPPGVRGSNQHPRFLPRRAGSAGVSPPRRARLGRGAGLGHLCPVAPLRQQRCVRELCIRTRFHSRRGVPEIIPRVFLHTDSLAVPINISAADAAVVLQWKPSPRAACPGALAKYRICHAAEGDNMTCEWDTPIPVGRRRVLPAGSCQPAPHSVLFAQTAKWMPRHQTTPSKTSSLAQPTGWVFGR